MTAVEDRLAEIEARAAGAPFLPDAPPPTLSFTFRKGEVGYELVQRGLDLQRDALTLVATLRAVLGEADPGNLIVGASAAWVAGYQDAMSDVRVRVAAGLDVTR